MPEERIMTLHPQGKRACVKTLKECIRLLYSQS